MYRYSLYSLVASSWRHNQSDLLTSVPRNYVADIRSGHTVNLITEFRNEIALDHSRDV